MDAEVSPPGELAMLICAPCADCRTSCPLLVKFISVQDVAYIDQIASSRHDLALPFLASLDAQSVAPSATQPDALLVAQPAAQSDVQLAAQPDALLAA
nr:hypothetical protein CFP56_60339 [Quercus suber]